MHDSEADGRTASGPADDSQPNLVMIPGHVVRDPSLSPAARLLFGVVLMHAHGHAVEGVDWDDWSTPLHDAAGLDRETCEMATAELINRGLVKVRQHAVNYGPWFDVIVPVARGVRMHRGGGESLGVPCVYCDDREATVRDHVLAKSKGGKSKRNLVPACGPCNGSKSAHDVREWVKRKGFDWPTIEARIIAHGVTL